MKIFISLLLGSIVFLNGGNYTFEAVKKDTKKRNLVSDMSKFISKNISRKSANENIVNDCSDITQVFTSDETIILKSNSFGPLPVTMKVVDDKGVNILQKTNEDNITSKFEIPVEKLQTDTKLQVFNAFDESIFCQTIKLVYPEQTK